VTQHIVLAERAVEAVKGVEAQMATNAAESVAIVDALNRLTGVIEQYRVEEIQDLEDEHVAYE
jgi:hypothetical protein